MDGKLAFAVQVVLWHPCHHDIRKSIHIRFPSEALAFSLFIVRWAEAVYKYWLKLNLTPRRPFRIYCLNH
jgi:hypothetical protein